MLNRWILAVLVFMLPLSSAVSQESQERAIVHQGFVKVEQYLDFGAKEQAIYAAGLVDGMYLAPVFDAPDNDKYLLAIRTCVSEKDMSNVQIAAIVTKYVKDHPESWDLGTHLLAYQALRNVCPLR